MAGPLANVRVLELAQFIAGPWPGMFLADMGADVVKIESPPAGDMTRRMGPFQNGESAGFLAANRNKRSAAINLKHEKGREAFLRLVERTDILIENFRPGTMADFGLDYDAVRQVNPAIVYCSVSGFGQTGPYAQRAGVNLIIEAMSGVLSVNGEPGEVPVRTAVQMADISGAFYATYAILSAYVGRLTTGQGRYVDVGLFESALTLGVWETTAFFATGEVPQPTGRYHRSVAPYQLFQTADGYIAISGSHGRHWQLLCEALDLPELAADRSLEDVNQRKARDVELGEVIEARTRERTTSYWVERLEAAGIPAGPLNNYAQAIADPHTVARGIIADVEHPRAGRVRMVGNPVKFDHDGPTIRKPAPMVGEHTAEVLAEVGYDSDEIARLGAEKAIMVAPNTREGGLGHAGTRTAHSDLRGRPA